MTNEWTKKLEELERLIMTLHATAKQYRDEVVKLIVENSALERENKELRSQRDYLQSLIDQQGGKG